MCNQTPSCANGPSGLPGLLTAQERDDMATFLERVSYPPARSRTLDDAVSATALVGFEEFFMDQNSGGNPDTCADSNAGCHEFPLGTGTNSETLNGFEVPTMRGLTDRFLQFSLGVTAPEEILNINNGTGWQATGITEFLVFSNAFPQGFTAVYGATAVPSFQMAEEASTGHSGATGRQVTLNTRTTGGALLAPTEALLLDLEAADERGVVNLRGAGLRGGNAVIVSYLSPTDEYQVGGVRLTHPALVAEAQVGTTSVTLTAHLRSSTSEDTAQPLLAPIGSNCGTGTGATGGSGATCGLVLPAREQVRDGHGHGLRERPADLGDDRRERARDELHRDPGPDRHRADHDQRHHGLRHAAAPGEERLGPAQQRGAAALSDATAQRTERHGLGRASRTPAAAGPGARARGPGAPDGLRGSASRGTPRTDSRRARAAAASRPRCARRR
jgi:hypothetical protein